MSLLDQRDLAIGQIRFAREYTLRLIDDFTPEEVFQQPNEGVTHLAWQLGHLAMAQYMLTLFRLRGKQSEDESVISKQFLKKFLKGTTPSASAEDYPQFEEIHTTFDAVFVQLNQEISSITEEQLQTKVVEPYAVYDNALGSLFFCAAHEMLHAGQIGLLRRLLGKPPIR